MTMFVIWIMLLHLLIIWQSLISQSLENRVARLEEKLK